MSPLETEGALSLSTPELVTLAYVIRDSRVLLIEKRTGHGAGKINAPGGHVEPRETAAQCAVRELHEETGLMARNTTMRARIKFWEVPDRLAMVGYIFVVYEFDGELKDSEEAKPFWCPIEEIPYGRMWSDDVHWVPLVLEGRGLVASFAFKDDLLVSRRVLPVAR